MKVRSRVRVDGGDGLRKGVRKRRNFAEEGISQETVFRRAIGCGGEEAVRDAKGGRRRRERGFGERWELPVRRAVVERSRLGLVFRGHLDIGKCAIKSAAISAAANAAALS